MVKKKIVRFGIRIWLLYPIFFTNSVYTFLQFYYYGCDCCREVYSQLQFLNSVRFFFIKCLFQVVEEIGVLGDCTKWGEPTGDDEFCYMK